MSAPPVTPPGRFADRAGLERELAGYAHGRVPRELRRRQVLAEGRDLFTERGYHGASMDELAQRVGVSKPVIYDLVGSKEQLFHELMTMIADDLSDAIRASVETVDDPGLWLQAGIRAFFVFVQAHRDAWERLLRGDAGPVTTAVAEIRRRQTDVVIELMTRAADRLGVVADAVLIDAAAHALNGANEALAIWWLDHPELDADDVAALVTLLVAPGLDALTNGGTPA